MKKNEEQSGRPLQNGERIEIGHCETCEHWDLHDLPDNGPPGGTYRICEHPKIADHGYSIDDSKMNTPDNVCDDALTCEWQEMGAPITGPKFGCVHWTKRLEPAPYASR